MANSILLIFIGIIQGMYSLTVDHNESVTAVEGQNISLHCIVGEENDINIKQLEWIKQQDQKIAVFNPLFSTHYFLHNFNLQLMNRSKTGKLQGSILHMYNVTVKDSGNYICEFISYPSGSFRGTAKVQVTEPPVSVKMSSNPYKFIKEGDEVKIICSASHSPIRYKLQRSKDMLFSLESLNGEFILHNVTRNNSDLYVCFPEWDSLAKNQQEFNTSVQLTVNFLDSIECNIRSPLKVSVGEDVAISCKAKASQSLQYKWMKGDTTVSSSDTFPLTSVTLEQSGTYKLTAAFQNNQLQTDMAFTIHVLTKTSERTTTQTTHSIVRSFSTAFPFLNQTSKHLSNLTSVETSSMKTGSTVTTTESGHLLTSTAKPYATMATLELIGRSSAPPVGNASTLHATTANSTHTSYTVNLSTMPDSTTRSKVFTSAVLRKNITTNSTVSGPSVTTPKASKSTAYIAVPIVLLLLVLIMLLYRRHLNQKRMDMPPPFKPPPPPVKYTSVRNQEVCMTDIIV
ncbi:cell adhesion molecule 1-like isoform X6 [Myxocyprinus asiaticus]|uniref:cell adhesion molecule 1-like isoform X6 n=1 Tax=Myxocyprinus asiaticus TaxID=70543 RepID=UPI002223A926|nr:cell adhesion molecule 1-like isoform X6 [Myxocyprinus asiaticus]